MVIVSMSHYVLINLCFFFKIFRCFSFMGEKCRKIFENVLRNPLMKEFYNKVDIYEYRGINFQIIHSKLKNGFYKSKNEFFWEISFFFCELQKKFILDPIKKITLNYVKRDFYRLIDEENVLYPDVIMDLNKLIDKIENVFDLKKKDKLMVNSDDNNSNVNDTNGEEFNTQKVKNKSKHFNVGDNQAQLSNDADDFAKFDNSSDNFKSSNDSSDVNKVTKKGEVVSKATNIEDKKEPGTCFFQKLDTLTSYSLERELKLLRDPLLKLKIIALLYSLQPEAVIKNDVIDIDYKKIDYDSLVVLKKKVHEYLYKKAIGE